MLMVIPPVVNGGPQLNLVLIFFFFSAQSFIMGILKLKFFPSKTLTIGISILKRKKNFQKSNAGTSLVVQWLRFHASSAGTRF